MVIVSPPMIPTSRKIRTLNPNIEQCRSALGNSTQMPAENEGSKLQISPFKREGTAPRCGRTITNAPRGAGGGMSWAGIGRC